MKKEYNGLPVLIMINKEIRKLKELSNVFKIEKDVIEELKYAKKILENHYYFAKWKYTGNDTYYRVTHNINNGELNLTYNISEKTLLVHTDNSGLYIYRNVKTIYQIKKILLKKYEIFL